MLVLDQSELEVLFDEVTNSIETQEALLDLTVREDNTAESVEEFSELVGDIQERIRALKKLRARMERELGS